MGRTYKYKKTKKNNCVTYLRTNSSRWYKLKENHQYFVLLEDAKDKYVCAVYNEEIANL